MPSKREDFDKIFKAVSGAGYYEKIHGANIGKVKWFDRHPQPQVRNEWKYIGPGTDITTAVEAIAKAEETTSEKLFSNVIDTPAYNTADYDRIRAFLKDWYGTLRTYTTYQANISDPFQLPNDQLDELFQSFGYNLSSSLRNPVTNNAPVAKVNFFLDLVNLYKIKGTPQALVSVLQYYGISDVDIYEILLQFEDRPEKVQGELMFKGRVVAGTTGDTSPIYLPFELLTIGDPHWLQSESQIRQLFNTNIINFPSQTPYFAVKPKFDEEATDAATGMLSRAIQDQHDDWMAGGSLAEDTNPILPQEAVITITGDTCSALTLYLSCIYIFNRDYNVGSPANRFVCYDGTATTTTEILEEFRNVTSRPSSRADQLIRWNQYLDTFSRDIVLNFLQTNTDAETVLGVLNPTVKANLDTLVESNKIILGSLLNDLGEWVRNNISYGFINMSYILFGIDSLFSQLRDVINFFKPYRARLVPLELIQFSNRLFNSIIIEDALSFDADLNFYDFITGDSAPCCADGTTIICFDSDVSDQYSREYFDCGSYFDIGAVVDTEIEIKQIEYISDCLRCPRDGTAFIVTEDLSDGTTIIICQSSGFRDFDEEGVFDCTHGFDLVFIESEDISGFLQQERAAGQGEAYILQENEGRIQL